MLTCLFFCIHSYFFCIRLIVFHIMVALVYEVLRRRSKNEGEGRQCVLSLSHPLRVEERDPGWQVPQLAPSPPSSLSTSHPADSISPPSMFPRLVCGRGRNGHQVVLHLPSYCLSRPGCSILFSFGSCFLPQPLSFLLYLFCSLTYRAFSSYGFQFPFCQNPELLFSLLFP